MSLVAGKPVSGDDGRGGKKKNGLSKGRLVNRVDKTEKGKMKQHCACDAKQQ